VFSGAALVWRLHHDLDRSRLVVPHGPVSEVRRLDGVDKLVGFDRTKPGSLLALFDHAGLIDIVLVALNSGEREVVESNQSPRSQPIQGLLGWWRRYGDIYLYTEGPEILISYKNQICRNVSDCGSALCSQPSFSEELNEVVYVRSVGGGQ
jgi:hypothetical protein